MPNMYSSVYPLFVELLQVVVGARKQLSVTPTDTQWLNIFAIANAQALTGICFAGIQMLPCEQQPHKANLLGNWFAQVQNIRHANAEQQRWLNVIGSVLQEAGLTPCLLKGQAAACRYPEQLRDLRMVGDVDVWVWQAEQALHDTIASCLSLARKQDGGTLRYHHVDCRIAGQMVELHFRPTFMSNPIHNYRLQKWSNMQRATFTCNPVWEMLQPNEEFDIVYQLAHIYRHLFDEGVGMRQVMDYYFVVKHFCGNKSATVQTMKNLGLYTICGAMMYVLQMLFALEPSRMLVPADVRAGKVVLEHIWNEGNFGVNRKQGVRSNAVPAHFVQKTCRNFRLLPYFVREVLPEPFFRIYHFVWRKWHHYL